jgi:hypothetical protein
VTDNVLEVLDKIEAQRAKRDAEEDEPRNALHYLQDVYRGRRQAEPWRMRAAIAALQFETPRLGVIATTNLNGADFAAPSRPRDRTQQRGAGSEANQACAAKTGIAALCIAR